MCLDCQREWRENHKEAVAAAMAHLDAEGVPEDSIARGIVNVHLACNANPILAALMQRCWADEDQLTQ